jgi:hypothetical protein
MPFRLSTLMATYALNWRFLRVDTADEDAVANRWRELLPKKLPTTDQRTRKSVARPQNLLPHILRRHARAADDQLQSSRFRESITDLGFGFHPSLGSSTNTIVGGP